MKSYPLIDLEMTDTPVFWVYNNLAHLYGYYNSFLTDNFENPQVSKIYIGDTKTNIKYIQDSNFDIILNMVFDLQIADFNRNFKNWDSSEFAITFFSAYQYKIIYPDELDNVFKINGYLCEETIFDFEKNGLYPNSQQLDLLVKEYLKDIEPDWTFGEHTKNETPFPLNNDRVYYFFEHHFESYQGDVHDFIKHCLEITNEVWKVKNKKNIKRQKYFDNWVSETLNNYPEIDPTKFYKKSETPKVTNDEIITIDELNSKNTSGSHLLSDLYTYLDAKAKNHKGNIYDYLNCVIEVTNNNWGDLMQDIIRKNIFQRWLGSFIMYNRLDKTKLN